MSQLRLLVVFSLICLVSCEYHRCSSTIRGPLSGGSIDSHHRYGRFKVEPGINCYWNIMVPKGYSLKLESTEFEIAPKNSRSKCTEDYFQINYKISSTNKWSGYAIFCGNNGPNLTINDIKYAALSFRTSSSYLYKGFNIKYSFAKGDSGNEITATTTQKPEPAKTTTRIPIGPQTTTKPSQPAPGSCGVPTIKPLLGNNGGGFRIVGGQEAIPGSWPWAVGLLKAGYQGCGGTLIHPEWVLTAAHCISDTSSWLYQVELGKHRRVDLKAQKIQVTKVFKHESYNIGIETDNDITLLKLAKPAQLNDRVSTACLPTVDIKDGQGCYTMGWGRTHGTSFHGNLKQVLLPAITTKTCRGYFGGKISDNMFCAGFKQGGHDSCQGDSGGPYVCMLNGRFQVQGIVSWGYGCAQANSPGVYTKVKNYIGWIRDIMKNN